MTLSDLLLLLDYHYWARDRVLAAAAQLPPEQFTRDMRSSFGSIRGTLAHLYFAEWVWHSRWRGTSPTEWPDAAQFHDVETLRDAWVRLEQQVRAFVHNLGEDGIARAFDYRTMAGKPGRSVFWQMLHHLVNHGSYHRGQVTTMLRQLGAPPAQGMDLIQFYRERR